MAPDLNKKLEDEVEKYRQTQNGKIFGYSLLICLSICNRYEEIRNSTTTIIRNKN
jgi:hypothetical protein